MKYGLMALALALVLVSVGAWAMSGKPPAAFKLHVKMTVTVETPEGDVVGSAVREIANEGTNRKVNWPHGGNPASVSGEAVVIDLGARGVLFALINENAEESRFYKAFPPPSGRPQSSEAMEYYASLPVGTSAVLDQKDWPMLVTFTDINDPKSVMLVWGGEFNSATQKYDPVDRVAEISGQGVALKRVTLEITDEPVTWGIIDKWLPSKLGELKKNWKNLPYFDKQRINRLITFKTGEIE